MSCVDLISDLIRINLNQLGYKLNGFVWAMTAGISGQIYAGLSTYKTVTGHRKNGEDLIHLLKTKCDSSEYE